LSRFGDGFFRFGQFLSRGRGFLAGPIEFDLPGVCFLLGEAKSPACILGFQLRLAQRTFSVCRSLTSCGESGLGVTQGFASSGLFGIDIVRWHDADPARCSDWGETGEEIEAARLRHIGQASGVKQVERAGSPDNCHHCIHQRTMVCGMAGHLCGALSLARETLNGFAQFAQGSTEIALA
jgi:hypothetical protein